MWSVLWSWTVIGFILSLIVGVGFSVMSMSPPEFTFARVCFSVAAIILLARVGTWLVPIVTESPFLERVMMSILIFGLIGIGWVESLLWVQRREAQLLENPPLLSHPLPKPPTELMVQPRSLPPLQKSKDNRSEKPNDQPPAIPPPQTKSEPQKVEPPILVGLRYTQKRTTSTNQELPYGQEITIQTDKVMQPTKLVVICDGKIGYGEFHLAVDAVYIKSKSGLAEGHPEAFLVYFESPPFSPQTPLIVTLFSKQAIKAIKVEQAPSLSF